MMSQPSGEPAKLPHCCDMMRYYVDHEDRVIYYWARFDEYLVPVHDGGTSGIQMRFCPWCGTRLPISKRDVVLAREEHEGHMR
ncbi:MAG TPA: hypothetical protein VFH48_27235 [Chloroflexota bacterium]|nr:hypothetical protein [Chloroflexota bacterium]